MRLYWPPGAEDDMIELENEQERETKQEGVGS